MPRKTVRNKHSTKRVKDVKGDSLQRAQTYLLVGILLWLVFGVYRWHQSRVLSFSGTLPSQISSVPTATSIAIPRVNIYLPVSEAKVVDGTWEISKDGASHWNSSANPGEVGNIVIYAHNKNNLFGPIRWLKVGDEIVLIDSLGGQHRYQIVNTITVNPDEINYILPTDEETLTLYTCTGWLDQQRYLVMAKPATETIEQPN